MKATSNTAAGSNSSQPWMCAVRRSGIPRAPPRAICGVTRQSWWRMGKSVDGFPPPIHARPARSFVSLAGAKDASRLLLSVFHCFFGGLGAGEGRLDAIVKRFGDALIVVGRQFGNGIFELITRHRRGWKVLPHISSLRGFPRRQGARRCSRLQFPNPQSVRASSSI